MDTGDNASASNFENNSISHENGNVKFNVIEMKLKQILEKLERHEQEIYNTKWKESITVEIAKISRKLESTNMDITTGDGDDSNPLFASKDMNRTVTNILLNDPSINKLSNDLKAIHAATRRLEGRQNEHAIVVSQVIELQHALEESVTAQADIYKSSEHFIVRKPPTPVNRSSNNSGKLTTALQTLLTGFQGAIDELARTVKKQDEMLEASNKIIQNLELSLKNSGTLAMTGNITIRSQLRSAAMLSRVSGQGRKLENFQAQLDSIAAENADNWAKARFSIVTIGLKTLAGVLKKRRRKDILRGWLRIKQWNKRITNMKLLRVQSCSRLGNIRRHLMLRAEFDTWKRSVYNENAAVLKRQRMLTLLALLRNRVFWDQRRLYTRWHKHMLLSRARARYVLPSEPEAAGGVLLSPSASSSSQPMMLHPISEVSEGRDLSRKGSSGFLQPQQQQQQHHPLHRSNTSSVNRIQSHEMMRRGSSYTLLQKQSSMNEDNYSDTIDPNGTTSGGGGGGGGGAHNKRGSGFRLDMAIPTITAAPPLLLSELQELLQMGGGIEPCLSFIVSYCQGVGARLQQTIDAHVAATRHMSELTAIVANSGAFNETKLNGRCDKMEDEVYRLETVLQKRLHSLEQEFDSLRDGSNHYSASVDTSLAAVTDRITKLEGKKGIDVDRIERLMLLQGDFLQRVDKIDARLSSDEIAISGIKVELLTHVTTFAELSEKYNASRRSWEEGLQFLEGQHHDLKQGERRMNNEVMELKGRMEASDRAADDLAGHLTKRLKRIEGILASAAPPPPSPTQLVDVFRNLEEEALKSSADGGVSFTKSLAGNEGRKLAYFAHRLANQLSAQADLDVLFGTIAGRRFGEPYGDNIPLDMTGGGDGELGVEGAALADPIPPEEETLHRREYMLMKFHQEFLTYLEKSYPMPGKLRTEARIMLHKKFLHALDTALSRHIPVSLTPLTSLGRSNAISNSNGVGTACIACDKPLRAKSAGRNSFTTGGGNRLNTEVLERNFSAFISRQFEGGGGGAAPSPPTTPFPTDHTISQELKGYDEMLSKLSQDQSRPTSSYANNNSGNNINNSAATSFTNNNDTSTRPNSAAAAGAGNSRHRVALKDATSYVKRGGFKFPAYSESEELVQSLVQPAGTGLEKVMKVSKEPVKNSAASRRTTSARLTQAGNSALSNGQIAAYPVNNFDSSEMTDEAYSPYHQRRLVGYNESTAMAGGADAEVAGRLGSTWSSIISSHQQSAYGIGLAGSESSPAVLTQPTPGYSAVSSSLEGGRAGSASYDTDKGGGNKRSRATKSNTVMNVLSYSGTTKSNKRQVATVGRGEFAKMIDSNIGANIDVDASSANLLQQTFDLALYSGTTR